MSVEARLEELGYPLPALRPAAGNYRGYVQVGDLLFTSGQGADGHVGRIGESATVEDGYAAARASVLNVLAQVKQGLGSLDRVAKIVKLNGYINATPEFADTPAVLNGASDLLVDAFGPEIGSHARSAIGAGHLPKGFIVELELVVQVKPA